MFSEAIRIVMDGLKNSESLDYITSNNYQKDINDIKYLLDIDKNEEIGLDAFKMIVQNNLINDNVMLDEQEKKDKKERLRKSYKKIIYFCDRMEYLGIICEDKDAQSTIINYYQSTIIKTYEKLRPLIIKTRIEQNNMDLFKQYENLYNQSIKQNNTTSNNKMKTKKKIFMAALMLLFSTTAMQAQTYEWERVPKEGEVVLKRIEMTKHAGTEWTYQSGRRHDERQFYSKEQIYKFVFDAVVKDIGDTFAIRDLKYRWDEKNDLEWKKTINDQFVTVTRYYYINATIVKPRVDFHEKIGKAIDKALFEIPKGARVAIDQIKTSNNKEQEDCKDQVVEILLDKGYKVVAKEYLQRIYDEQLQQQSGIYNEETTVQGNNFSAAGYYLNVRVTEKAVKVQVINVSTGEYEGNATVNF